MAKTRIISCLNLKGGAGKSSLATNLACELAKHGTTCLVDGDNEQGTAGSWYSLRQESTVGRGSAQLSFASANNHKELIKQVENRSERWVVVDGPPRLAEMTRAAIVLSDLVLIPMATSSVEIWSSGDLLSLIAEAKKVRRGIKAMGIWSRYRNTRVNQDIAEQASEVLKLKFCESVMTNRVVYQTAMGQGRSVCEMKDKSASAEMTALVAEVMNLVGGK